MKFEKYFDHTVLKPDATSADVERACDEALKYGFASVCVNGCFAGLASGRLKDSDVAVCVVVGFPLGAMDTDVKAYEASKALEEGADEIDMVINVGALKEGNDDYVMNDIRRVKQTCGDKVLKVIIETCLLTEEEKVRACRLAVEAGADFVKTSTGFSAGGATITDVALMRETVGDRAKIKASGGIRDYNTAQAMIDAGADRLGTSATVKIVSSSSI